MAAMLLRVLLAIILPAVPSRAFVPAGIVHPPHVHVLPKISDLPHEHSHSLDSRTGTRLLPPMMRAGMPVAASSYSGDSPGDAALGHVDHPSRATMAALGQGAYLVHSHGGPVHLIEASVSEEEWAEDFKSKLQACDNVLGLTLGFISEEATQDRNKEKPICLVSLAVGDTVWLIRTSQAELPQVVRDVLVEKSVVKLVLFCHAGALAGVFRPFGLDLGSQPGLYGFVGIDDLARKRGMPNRGIKSLAAHYGYNFEPRTSVGKSNWAAPKLSPMQQQLAADYAYFNLLVGRWLLEESAVMGKGMSAHEFQAWQALTGHEIELVGALHVEDCTALHAGRMAFWARVRDAVRGVCESTGQASIPLAQLWELRDAGGRYFRTTASQLGETMYEADVRAQSTHFALNHAVGMMLRPRSDAERVPPSQEELNLPWATDPNEALKKWSGLQSIGGSLNNVELRGRLALLRESFLSNGDWAPANSIGALLHHWPNV